MDLTNDSHFRFIHYLCVLILKCLVTPTSAQNQFQDLYWWVSWSPFCEPGLDQHCLRMNIAQHLEKCPWILLINTVMNTPSILFFFSFIFISWRLITLQYWSGFCHTLTWISHGFTCIPHPNPHSHLPLHPIPLGLPSAPALSTCFMHPNWAGDLFHPR